MVGLVLWVVGLAFIAAGAVAIMSAGSFSAAQQASMGKNAFGRFLLGLNETLAREQKQSQGAKHMSQFGIMGGIVLGIGVVLIILQLAGALGGG